MLVIARKVGQTVLIGDQIEITVSSVRGDQVRLAINAPRAISIFRKEAVEQVERGNAAAVDAAAGLLDLLASLPEAENRAAPPPFTPDAELTRTERDTR
jgi:carbon storage regulator